MQSKGSIYKWASLFYIKSIGLDPKTLDVQSVLERSGLYLPDLQNSYTENFIVPIAELLGIKPYEVTGDIYQQVVTKLNMIKGLQDWVTCLHVLPKYKDTSLTYPEFSITKILNHATANMCEDTQTFYATFGLDCNDILIRYKDSDTQITKFMPETLTINMPQGEERKPYIYPRDIRTDLNRSYIRDCCETEDLYALKDCDYYMMDEYNEEVGLPEDTKCIMEEEVFLKHFGVMRDLIGPVPAIDVKPSEYRKLASIVPPSIAANARTELEAVMLYVSSLPLNTVNNKYFTRYIESKTECLLEEGETLRDGETIFDHYRNKYLQQDQHLERKTLKDVVEEIKATPTMQADVVVPPVKSATAPAEATPKPVEATIKLPEEPEQKIEQEVQNVTPEPAAKTEEVVQEAKHEITAAEVLAFLQNYDGSFDALNDYLHHETTAAEVVRFLTSYTNGDAELDKLLSKYTRTITKEISKDISTDDNIYDTVLMALQTIREDVNHSNNADVGAKYRSCGLAIGALSTSKYGDFGVVKPLLDLYLSNAAQQSDIDLMTKMISNLKG